MNERSESDLSADEGDPAKAGDGSDARRGHPSLRIRHRCAVASVNASTMMTFMATSTTGSVGW